MVEEGVQSRVIMSNGMVKTQMQGITFDLPIKYSPIKLIGKGTYGSVVSATNKETDEQVAIKKLSHIEDLVRTINKTWKIEGQTKYKMQSYLN